MNTPHQGAEVALNVAPRMNLAPRPVFEADTIAFAASAESLAVKFAGVV